MHPIVQRVTDRIAERSAPSRAAYLSRIAEARGNEPGRAKLSCANFAHAFAAAPDGDKATAVRNPFAPNLAIVTAYNDMLSAHQPFERFPEIIRAAARAVGATAQVAGGAPAMCDGVTQGRPGMELSLFSRDVIVMATAIALTHDAFDAALCLGVCDKIIPGLVIGALSFGHLPVIMAPAGPMTSGVSNAEKARTRARFAQGQIGRDELLASEMKSYHGPGTCTFYGTANSNQMMMELSGLHLPGTAFVHPNTPLRDAIVAHTAQRAIQHAKDKTGAMADIIDAPNIVNMIVGLLATGGSTNHTLHIPAMAAAAGLIVTWDDFDDLSHVTPLIARVYPNGGEDVNVFHAAGGMAFVTRTLLAAGLLHEKVRTVAGAGLAAYTREPFLDGETLIWREGAAESLNRDVLRAGDDPFEREGGIRLVQGGLGRAVAKASAVKAEHRIVEAPARVFDDHDQVQAAFQAGDLAGDFIAVVRFQGPRANGMPELHTLTPALGVLLDRGAKVALVTDGRMSGASGKVPAALHVTPEAACGGAIARIRDGDLLRLDLEAGRLEVLVDAEAFAARPLAEPPPHQAFGYGRELFAHARAVVGAAEAGASMLGFPSAGQAMP
jgi:phosphogluconate dehydratase